MATYDKFQQFVEDLAHKVHNLGSDTLQVALVTSASGVSASLDAVLADITQIAYTNLSTQVITTSSSAHTTGTYKLTLNDLVLTASGGAVAAFRYVVVFNQSSATPTDALICSFDYGSDLTLADGESLTIDFEANAGSTGILFSLT